MDLQLPTGWMCPEDLALLNEADRTQVLDWLRGCGVNPDRTRAIRIEATDPDQPPIVVAQEYVKWPIRVGLHGIETRTEAHVAVGDVPRSLSELVV